MSSLRQCHIDLQKKYNVLFKSTKLYWNLNQDTVIFIPGNAFENVLEVAALLSRPKCIQHKMYAMLVVQYRHIIAL